MTYARNVGKAIDCALSMQQACLDYSASREKAEQIRLCVGLDEDLARAGEILVTDVVHKAAPKTAPEHVLEPISEVPPGAQAAFRLR